MRVSRTKIFAFAASLALVAAAVFVFHALAAPRPVAKHTQPAAPAQAADASAENISVLYFAKNPEAAPPFLVRDLSGSVVSTAALKGKVVLLNFWATWCGPCREEIPEMIKLQAQYKDTLQIIGASEDEAPPE